MRIYGRRCRTRSGRLSCNVAAWIVIADVKIIAIARGSATAEFGRLCPHQLGKVSTCFARSARICGEIIVIDFIAPRIDCIRGTEKAGCSAPNIFSELIVGAVSKITAGGNLVCPVLRDGGDGVIPDEGWDAESQTPIVVCR